MRDIRAARVSPPPPSLSSISGTLRRDGGGGGGGAVVGLQVSVCGWISHVHVEGGSRGPLGWVQRLPNPIRVLDSLPGDSPSIGSLVPENSVTKACLPSSSVTALKCLPVPSGGLLSWAC